MRVEVVMTYLIQGQNQKSMFIKLHVSDDNNEVKKKETIKSNITHEKKSKKDENEVKSNGKRIKKANRNVNGRVEYGQYNPNLKKDENNIWKGRRRKLLQTSSIQIPMPTDNQKKRKKWLMPIGLNYQGHRVSEKDVWMINSYYRISDGERGDRK